MKKLFSEIVLFLISSDSVELSNLGVFEYRSKYVFSVGRDSLTGFIRLYRNSKTLSISNITTVQSRSV